jgi:HEAT repeat protein
VSGGLETTFQVLGRTKNEAAVRLLVGALDSPDRTVQTSALRALLKRRSAVGQRELLRRWPSLTDRWKSIIAERPGRISNAVRDAILNSESDLRANGCDAVLWIRDFDLIPVLITAAEDKSNSQAGQAAQTLLSLCEMLSEELATPREYGNRRDPEYLQSFVVNALEQSTRRFGQHQRSEVIEAFLLLARLDDGGLQMILQNPRDKVYLITSHLLMHSPRPGVMRLLVRFLDDAHAPTTVHNVIARRRDIPFLRHLLKRVNEELTPVAKGNLRRIESFAWLQGDLGLLSAFNDVELNGVVRLAMASGMKRLAVFEVLKTILRTAGVEGRRAATEALVEFRGADANKLLLTLLRDPDPDTQAIAVGQLRDRGIPGALATLIDLLESPHAPVRNAARKSLSEFRFQRYLDTFDLLDNDVRRDTGQLVMRVDLQAADRLIQELKAPSRTRRYRALAMVEAMGAVAMVEHALLGLLGDADDRLRTEVVRLLADRDTPKIRRALRALLTDESVIVKEAAELALQALADNGDSSQLPDLSFEPGSLPIDGVGR